MAKYIKNEVAYYYDSHPTEEDLMGEAPIHRELIHYLADVLKWLFREQVCVVYENINVFQTSEEDEYPIAPDIAVTTPFTITKPSKRPFRLVSPRISLQETLC